MSEKQEKLSERTVKIHGIEHTMMLNDEDAERYDANETALQAQGAEADQAQGAEADEKATKAPANKARRAEDK